MLGPIEKLGGYTLDTLRQTGRMGIFFSSCLKSIATPPLQIFAAVRQIYFIGARSVSVVVVTGLFTGMVLGLQGYHTLSRFHSEELLGSVVGLSLIRELGPVLTALMVIGRAGSAICAEIGIMRNSEQIDALKCMAIDPYKYLMAPKVVAALVSVPLLTALFDVIGIAGGYLVGVVLLGVSKGAYLQGMYASVAWADVWMGLVKSLMFGLLMVGIAAAKGYYLHLERNAAFGAEGVSRVTTEAVVASAVAVLVWDYLISAVML